jgi:hypothetical protein
VRPVVIAEYFGPFQEFVGGEPLLKFLAEMKW